MIPILQFLPAMGIWFGLMSIPLIGFIALMFQYPIIVENAVQIIFINHYHGKSVFVLGLIFLIFSSCPNLYQISRYTRFYIFTNIGTSLSTRKLGSDIQSFFYRDWLFFSLKLFLQERGTGTIFFRDCPRRGLSLYLAENGASPCKKVTKKKSACPSFL